MPESDGFQQAQRAEGVDLAVYSGDLEDDLRRGSGRQIVDLVGLTFLNHADQIAAVGQVAVVEESS